MPDTRTTITELVTGLGMLGHSTVEETIAARPPEMASVSPQLWDELDRWSRSPTWTKEFAAAFRNGVVFLGSPGALRDRIPQVIDWRGNTRPVDDDLVPADLRIDHVYLVSCKYLSKVLGNAAPSRLFDGLLRVRTPADRLSWFEVVAADELEVLTEASARHAGIAPVRSTASLGASQLAELTASLSGAHWPDSCAPAWRALVQAVSVRTAERWRAAIATPQDALRLLWRLIRIGPTPYFVLGVGSRGPLRLRIVTSWDWSQRFQLEDFEVEPGDAGQPVVRWVAHVLDRDAGHVEAVAGHVEVRWSHGRLRGAPEAKIYLDTPHDRVSGYVPL